MVTIDDLCELPAGWITAFGNDLVRDLNGVMGDVAQEVYVKEKWGSLSAYISLSSDDIEVVVDKYKRIARQTCAGCGAPARQYRRVGYCLGVTTAAAHNGNINLLRHIWMED